MVFYVHVDRDIDRPNLLRHLSPTQKVAPMNHDGTITTSLSADEMFTIVQIDFSALETDKFDTVLSALTEAHLTHKDNTVNKSYVIGALLRPLEDYLSLGEMKEWGIEVRSENNDTIRITYYTRRGDVQKLIPQIERFFKEIIDVKQQHKCETPVVPATT